MIYWQLVFYIEGAQILLAFKQAKNLSSVSLLGLRHDTNSRFPRLRHLE